MKNKTPFRERFWRFMQGRNGVDALYNFQIILSVILITVNFFLKGIPELIVSAVYFSMISWALFRYFSKNLYKRRKENDDFLRFIKSIKGFFRLQRDRIRDRKTHVYRKCKNCKNILRLPKKPGQHKVCCPCCSHRFNVYIAGFAEKDDKK
ncbi:MAG: hypothetical protein IJD70_06075 [Clostridia bacterium]|nr:hypothetical protein [Clostridia bacterium]